MRIRYVVSVLCWSDPVDAEETGDNYQSVVSMGVREGIGGVG